jgi:hypothetical protein
MLVASLCSSAGRSFARVIWKVSAMKPRKRIAVIKPLMVFIFVSSILYPAIAYLCLHKFASFAFMTRLFKGLMRPASLQICMSMRMPIPQNILADRSIHPAARR